MKFLAPDTGGLIDSTDSACCSKSFISYLKLNLALCAFSFLIPPQEIRQFSAREVLRLLNNFACRTSARHFASGLRNLHDTVSKMSIRSNVVVFIAQ